MLFRSFGALSFGGLLPRSGDILLLKLTMAELERKGYFSGFLYLSILLAAAEVEKKTGFINYRLLVPFYEKCVSARYIGEMRDNGYLTEIPFPDTFSHILRRSKCYKLSEKGHSCLRLFRDTYNSYQREVKRAKIKGAEIGK